jgi:kynurenine aminotransferase
VRRGVLVLSDEVYEHLHYTPSFARMATLSPALAQHTVTVGSVGKLFNATGWRVGFAIGPARLIEHVKQAHIVLGYTTPGPAQDAAASGFVEAARIGYWAASRTEMLGRVRRMCDALDKLGLSVSDSAFLKGEGESRGMLAMVVRW